MRGQPGLARPRFALLTKIDSRLRTSCSLEMLQFLHLDGTNSSLVYKRWMRFDRCLIGSLENSGCAPRGVTFYVAITSVQLKVE